MQFWTSTTSRTMNPKRKKKKKSKAESTNDDNENSSNNNKNSAKDAKLFRRQVETRLWAEVMLEIQPLAIGSIAMVASSYCNQGMYKEKQLWGLIQTACLWNYLVFQWVFSSSSSLFPLFLLSRKF